MVVKVWERLRECIPGGVGGSGEVKRLKRQGILHTALQEKAGLPRKKYNGGGTSTPSSGGGWGKESSTECIMSITQRKHKSKKTSRVEYRRRGFGGVTIADGGGKVTVGKVYKNARVYGKGYRHERVKLKQTERKVKNTTINKEGDEEQRRVAAC